MFPWLIGIAGFVLYLLYDLDSFLSLWRPLRWGFGLGTALLLAATVFWLYTAVVAGAIAGVWDILLLALGAAGFVALLYCLFFALPFEATYTDPERGRRVYDRGVYALCRHPGIICFFVMYLFWGLAALPSGFLIWGVAMSGLNLLYALFQDRVTFPKTFCDYAAYRENVPFLLPTAASIRRAVRSWGEPYEKEEKP